MKTDCYKNTFKHTLVRTSLFILVFFSAEKSLHAQNLVPNPGFEDTLGCVISIPDITCLLDWTTINTGDLCFNGAVFFPPSTIPAYEGTKYGGIECSIDNPEYFQVQLNQTLQAGKRYCVSFRTSVCDWSTQAAPSMGIYFSNGFMTTNPHTTGLNAHVQESVVFDPTSWQLVSGMYTASGGEDHLVIGCFENVLPSLGPYMYIDMIEVYELPDAESVFNLEICPDSSLILSAVQNASSYTWNTGATTSTITVNQIGFYQVEYTIGHCTLIDSFYVSQGLNCIPDTNPPTEQTLFIPSSFTPNSDGINDVFSIYGIGISKITVLIFNRWGEVIYESKDVAFRWDGTMRGQTIKSDVYVYRIQFENTNGFNETVIGRITLLR